MAAMLFLCSSGVKSIDFGTEDAGRLTSSEDDNPKDVENIAFQAGSDDSCQSMLFTEKPNLIKRFSFYVEEFFENHLQYLIYMLYCIKIKR